MDLNQLGDVLSKTLPALRTKLQLAGVAVIVEAHVQPQRNR
jgi:hypothetical protein